MQYLAILRRAAEFLDEPIYVFGDDAKDYFNQLGVSSSELWKLGLVLLEHQGDLTDAPSSGSRLIFISEKRLVFGTHRASNVAQRFSYAILDLFRDAVDEAESQVEQPARLREWLKKRNVAHQASKEPVHCTRRWQEGPTAE